MREVAERVRGCSTSTAYSVSLAYASLSSWQGRGKLGSFSMSDSSPDSYQALIKEEGGCLVCGITCHNVCACGSYKRDVYALKYRSGMYMTSRFITDVCKS